MSKKAIGTRLEQADQDHVPLAQGGTINLPDGHDYRLAGISDDGAAFILEQVGPGR